LLLVVLNSYSIPSYWKSTRFATQVYCKSNNYSLLAMCMLDAITISTPMVVMTTLTDWITFIPIGCFQFLTTVIFYTLCEVVLAWVRQYSILWLPIGSLYDAKCGCEYTSSSLLLNYMDGWICWFCGPNWLPNSMPFSLFRTTWISSSYSYEWSINVLATFYNSTCLAVLVLMWKSTKGQSIIACPFSSHNANSWK
jgi:hypothetical protein